MIKLRIKYKRGNMNTKRTFSVDRVPHLKHIELQLDLVHNKSKLDQMFTPEQADNLRSS